MVSVMSFKEKFNFDKEKEYRALRIEDKSVSEEEAEIQLEELLARPENKFLLEHAYNRENIDNAASAREALQFAKKRLQERLKKTFEVRQITREGAERIEADPESVISIIESIQRNSEEIGRGADGNVVIDQADCISGRSEICYKFMLQESVKRGRNSASAEAEIQNNFYDAWKKSGISDIRVPEVFYEVEVFATQMIAMERLHARSIDDILRGMGTLPVWFDVDRFCDSLRMFINAMHENNLYHRDMHLGNILISQEPAWSPGDAMGYVIDFGLSDYAFENMDPYRKEVAGTIFTYDDDYGRIPYLQKMLHDAKKRRTYESK